MKGSGDIQNVFVFLWAQRKLKKRIRSKGSRYFQETPSPCMRTAVFNHLRVTLHFNTPWKYSKTSNLKMFSGGIEGKCWHEID